MSTKVIVKWFWLTRCFDQQVKCLCGLLSFWPLSDTSWSANLWAASNSQPLMLELDACSPGSWLPPVPSLLFLAGPGIKFLSSKPTPPRHYLEPLLHWSSHNTTFLYLRVWSKLVTCFQWLWPGNNQQCHHLWFVWAFYSSSRFKNNLRDCILYVI